LPSGQCTHLPISPVEITRRRRQKRSGILVKAIRVGAAALASSMLAEKSVAVPYFWFSASIVLMSRFRFDSVSRLEKRLSVCRRSGSVGKSAQPPR
jgi:hypothetical protein